LSKLIAEIKKFVPLKKLELWPEKRITQFARLQKMVMTWISANTNQIYQKFT